MVTKYEHIPRNIPEERRPQFHRRGSLKSRTICIPLIKFLSLDIFPIITVASGATALLVSKLTDISGFDIL